jgi:hypothetical protein
VGEINLSNSGGRDAVVSTESVSPSTHTRWLGPKNRQANSARVAKSTVEYDIDALLEKHGDLAVLAQALVADDPEIDFENTGRLLNETSRVYIDDKRSIVRNVRFL